MKENLDFGVFFITESGDIVLARFDDELTEGQYLLTFHWCEGERAYRAEQFETLDELTSAMRQVQADLRKWQKCQ